MNMMKDMTQWPKIIGHRGAKNLWPENSLFGFRQVVGLPIDAIEFDVQLTDAGEIVVIHDATLERTTERSGTIRELTRKQRLKTRLKQCNECIPVLNDVLEILVEHPGIEIHIELKSDAPSGAHPSLLAGIVEALQSHQVAHRSVVTSFKATDLKCALTVAPEITRLLSINKRSADMHNGLLRHLEDMRNVANYVAVFQPYLEDEWACDNECHPTQVPGYMGT